MNSKNYIDYKSEECLNAFNLVQTKLNREDRCKFISNQIDFYVKEKTNYQPTEDELESLFTTYKTLKKLIEQNG